MENPQFDWPNGARRMLFDPLAPSASVAWHNCRAAYIAYMDGARPDSEAAGQIIASFAAQGLNAFDYYLVAVVTAVPITRQVTQTDWMTFDQGAFLQGPFTYDEQVYGVCPILDLVTRTPLLDSAGNPRTMVGAAWQQLDPPVNSINPSWCYVMEARYQRRQVIDALTALAALTTRVEALEGSGP